MTRIPFLYKNIHYDVSDEDDSEYYGSFSLANYESNLLVQKDEFITKEKEIKIILDYPLNNEYEFTFTSENGFTFDQFIKNIITTYKQIYADEKADCGATDMIPGTYNRDTSSGRYGIWGYSTVAQNLVKPGKIK